MADYPAKHEFVDDYPYLAYASEVDTVAGSGGGEGGEGGGGGASVLIVNDVEDASTHVHSLDTKFSEIAAAFQTGIVLIKIVETLDDITQTTFDMILSCIVANGLGALETKSVTYTAQSLDGYPIVNV